MTTLAISARSTSPDATGPTGLLPGAAPTARGTGRCWQRLLTLAGTLARPSTLGVLMVLAALTLQIALMLQLPGDTSLTVTAPPAATQPAAGECALICPDASATERTPAARAIAALDHWIQGDPQPDTAGSQPIAESALT
ncbi:hypothetical protein [Nocardia sp. IFM 10818]